jgi:diguanylate cyclase (GGDEF)-like protein
LAIGGIDTVTSYDISVSVLYFLPIILIAWFEGGLSAALIALLSAITWAISDLLSGHMYSHFAVPIWNAIMMLGMFLTVAYSITALKKLFAREREHAHIDDLTGVANIRFFYEQARIEISRSTRDKQPLTLTCIDVDSLRHVNETLGHFVGDYLLHETAQILMSTLRATDIIARLSGAKFAILMPETKNENAIAIVYKVQEHLMNLVKKHGWPVTFSIGVVTCDGLMSTPDKLIATAEDLMDAARNTDENRIKYKILDLSSEAS